MVDGKALVDAVKKEIIEPGIQSLMNTPVFHRAAPGQVID